MPAPKKSPKPIPYVSPLEEAKKILGDLIEKIGDNNTPPFKIGAKYLIQTASQCWIGRVGAIKGGFLVLTHAAWAVEIDFEKALTTGKINECAPAPREVLFNIASIVDACEWHRKLP